ncbi:uncharacterized protein J4E79_011174 [Alternaria viburni]|uniref:uncharacterized protein n=1 Tax=Alternaria viburni TaxID=566460 RepID=UPI0020C35A24|nr:uncharacterized protein J4E79_011174 [Alternaria viburni]KAI4643902.1 hypothetical protein J4E79_011174 [Alternaria viburni]
MAELCTQDRPATVPPLFCTAQVPRSSDAGNKKRKDSSSSDEKKRRDRPADSALHGVGRPNHLGLKTATTVLVSTTSQLLLRAKRALAPQTQLLVAFLTDGSPYSLPPTRRLRKSDKKHLRNPLHPRAEKDCDGLS